MASPEKNAPRAARKLKFLYNSSLGCFVVLSLFSYPLFNDYALSVEKQLRAVMATVKSYLFTGEDPKTATALQIADKFKFEVPEQLKESNTSPIYPKLELARKALAAQAQLDANKVWLSCLSKDSDEIVVVELSKQELRKRGAEIPVTIKDSAATLIVDEPNGVNTKVTIKSEQNWLPLTLAYPIDRGGLRIAYYTPAHYQLRSPELVADGKAYINNHVVNARAELTKAGYQIGDNACEMAAKLSVVEHVDHSRFINEPYDKIFAEIYTLYALNRNETYRYSISVAGAGGMIQMIPSTYKIVRQRFPQAALGEDFVTAMTAHGEAMKAMLLYLAMTYDYFQSNNVVAQAINSSLARLNDLMAAGYNSNPARIPSYINSHNGQWTTVIPRETKVYLSILRTLENPDDPQVEMAREYLQTPVQPVYHTKVVRAAVSRSSRYKTQTVASKSAVSKSSKGYRTRNRAR